MEPQLNPVKNEKKFILDKKLILLIASFSLFSAILSGTIVYILTSSNNQAKINNDKVSAINTTVTFTPSVTLTPTQTVTLTSTEKLGPTTTTVVAKSYAYNLTYLKANLLTGFTIKETKVTDADIKSGFLCNNGDIYKYSISKPNAEFVDILFCSKSSEKNLLTVAKSYFSHEYPEPTDGKNGSPSFIESSAKPISKLNLSGYSGNSIDYGFTSNFEILSDDIIVVLIERGGFDTPYNGVQKGISEYNQILDNIQIKL